MELVQESRQKKPQPDLFKRVLEKQGYHLVGNHSAVKQCEWTHNKLTGKGGCYKNTFYGIQSHRCIQGTALLECFNSCNFCWRVMPEAHEEHGIKLLEKMGWNEPKEIVDGFIKEQRKIVSGYGGNEKTDKNIWNEANDPKHVALSLIGEPILYPKLIALLEEFHGRGISTFLVTNGIYPHAMRAMIKAGVFPTQFYLSMSGWDEASYNEICRPLLPNAWNNYLESIDLLKQMNTRRVIRMTIVEGLNSDRHKEFGELIKRSQADYVECKGFVSVGYARQRLGIDRMPSNEELRQLSNKLAEETGYAVTAEHEASRCILLCRNETAVKERFIDFESIGKLA